MVGLTPVERRGARVRPGVDENGAALGAVEVAARALGLLEVAVEGAAVALCADGKTADLIFLVRAIVFGLGLGLGSGPDRKQLNNPNNSAGHRTSPKTPRLGLAASTTNGLSRVLDDPGAGRGAQMKSR